MQNRVIQIHSIKCNNRHYTTNITFPYNFFVSKLIIIFINMLNDFLCLFWAPTYIWNIVWLNTTSLDGNYEIIDWWIVIWEIIVFIRVFLKLILIIIDKEFIKIMLCLVIFLHWEVLENNPIRRRINAPQQTNVSFGAIFNYADLTWALIPF